MRALLVLQKQNNIKWVSSVFPFAASCPQGHSAAENAPEPDLPWPLYCNIHSDHFLNSVLSSYHTERNLSSFSSII